MSNRFRWIVGFVVLGCLVVAVAFPARADGEGFESDSFTVASYPDAAPKWPCVARGPEGDFVVVWAGPDDDGSGIFARRYAADGTPRGDAFAVNDVTTDDQTCPSVALADDGRFVVTWVDHRDGATDAVYARTFDAGASPEGASFRVDVPSDGSRRLAGSRAVAFLPDGGFAVAWAVMGGEGRPVYGRLFDPDGTPRGEPFRVADWGNYPSVDRRGGDLLFSWGGGRHARGRLYDLSGNPRGEAFDAGETEDAVFIAVEGRIRPSGDFAFGYPHSYWVDEYVFFHHKASHVSRDGVIEKTVVLDETNETANQGNESWRVVPLVDHWGRMTAVFTDLEGYSSFPDRVRARRYDDDFEAQGLYFDVAAKAPGEDSLRYATADLDGDGDIVIAWTRMVTLYTGSLEARLLCASLDTVGPADTDACEGARVELRAETRGRPPFTWQWRKDGDDLEDGDNVSGANTDTLVLDPVRADDAGSYDCVVHDGCPDVQTYVTRSAALTVHGAIPEVPGLMLRKENQGNDLHFTWQDVENAVDYVVRQDTEPDGAFDTVTGTAESGTEGLTVPMPEGPILFFKVHGRNPGCEGP